MDYNTSYLVTNNELYNWKASITCNLTNKVNCNLSELQSNANESYNSGIKHFYYNETQYDDLDIDASSPLPSPSILNGLFLAGLDHKTIGQITSLLAKYNVNVSEPATKYDDLLYNLLVNISNDYSNLTSSITHTQSSGENDTGELYEVPTSLVVLLSIFYGVISLVAVTGNVVVMWVILSSRMLQSVINYFIANLALADIIIGLFSIPFQVS